MGCVPFNFIISSHPRNHCHFHFMNTHVSKSVYLWICAVATTAQSVPLQCVPTKYYSPLARARFQIWTRRLEFCADRGGSIATLRQLRAKVDVI